MSHCIEELDRGVVWGTTWHNCPQYVQQEEPVSLEQAEQVLIYPVEKVPLYMQDGTLVYVTRSGKLQIGNWLRKLREGRILVREIHGLIAAVSGRAVYLFATNGDLLSRTPCVNSSVYFQIVPNRDAFGYKVELFSSLHEYIY